MSIFEKYSAKINSEELAASQKEISENANGGGSYEEVPVGKYEVKVEKMEAKMSKTNKPMVTVWFRILKGKYEKSMIFYNSVFHEDWMRHRVASFLSDLIDDGDRTAEINLLLKSYDMETINNFCMDAHEQIDGEFEYLLDYGMSNGYSTYKIEEVYMV